MRILKEHIIVEASKDIVWQAWTISEEVMKWFVPKAVIVAEEGGKYDVSYDPEQERDRSEQNCKILSIQPTHRLVFQWKIPEIAGLIGEASTTVVAVCLKELSNQTTIIVSHSGWGEGSEWLRVMEWHKQNWALSLKSLKSYLETGQGFIAQLHSHEKN
ncbi:SRPBCC family protein [Bacillus litorisediminis]|uniref:SRPBCC family protein n=1 Tax=Bacillus litorisediminis TaxID=2922713 RepID=UPI001FAD8C03|nr:SRPBCC domain-containing protein [Bacillus litorisediminis]